MGNDPTTSVLNGNCQAHDVKNLFVADGGPFVSQPDKNPTWTILALAMRTERVHRGETAEGGGSEDWTLNRDAAAELLASAPLGGRGFAWTEAEAARGASPRAGARAQAAQTHGTPFKPKFFTAARVRDRARARRI